ncbi:MAG: SMR family transporter [Verrucomicrobiota bacterium]
MSGYLFLAIAIIFEVIGTSALKATEGFTKLWPSLITVAGYAIAFYCLGLALKSIDVGIAYAIWAGVGIVLVAIAASVIYKQVPDMPAILGMVMIIGGVVVINVFSKTTGH